MLGGRQSTVSPELLEALRVERAKLAQRPELGAGKNWVCARDHEPLIWLHWRLACPCCGRWKLALQPLARVVERGLDFYSLPEADPDFFCPISMTLMRQPVFASDGSGPFDRKSLEEWLDTCKNDRAELRSPLTNQPVRKEQRPRSDDRLCRRIEAWLRGEHQLLPAARPAVLPKQQPSGRHPVEGSSKGKQALLGSKAAATLEQRPPREVGATAALVGGGARADGPEAREATKQALAFRAKEAILARRARRSRTS